jgi:hypothetical protein
MDRDDVQAFVRQVSPTTKTLKKPKRFCVGMRNWINQQHGNIS